MSGGSSSSGRRLVARRVVFAVAVAVAVIGSVQAIAGALKSGITVDEPTHISRAQAWIEDGWYVPGAYIEDGEPIEAGYASPSLYGPAFAAIVQATTFAAGLASIDEVVTTASGWALRHLLTALLGIATALAAGFGVYTTTRSKLFSVWTVAALLAVPLWLGMSFFNPKDVPAATGYTLVTVALIVALSVARSPGSTSRRASVTLVGLMSVGTFLAVGTRIALWVPVLIAVVTYVSIVIAGRAEGDRLAGRGIGWVLLGIAGGGALLLAVYPAVFTHPIEALVESVSGSSGYPWTGYTLTAGRLLDETPPLWYLPAWTVASVPSLILILATAGLISSTARVAPMAVRGRGPARERVRRIANDRSAPILLIAQQALLLPIASAAVGATMYTGIRQFLFMVPALAMLAGVGAAWLWRIAERRKGRVWRPAAAVALLLALLIPMLEGGLLFPYNYAYVTPIAGIGGVSDRWETDYWWASAREAYGRVPSNRNVLCGSSSSHRRRDGSVVAPACEVRYESFFDPYLDERSTTDAEERAQWVLVRRREGNGSLPGCDPAESVTRWLRGERVVMSYVLRCPKTPDAVRTVSAASDSTIDLASR